MPTNTEYDEISKKTETLENEEDFVEHELFIVLRGCISCNKERLQAIHFKNIYSKECVHILHLIDNVFMILSKIIKIFIYYWKYY